MTLFEYIVRPILMYGCEVWGLRTANPIEKFHLSFLKGILEVKSSTPNCFIYGELGVLPLIIERKMRVIKYWIKIIKNLNTKEHFVHKIYKELLKISNENPEKETWVSGVKVLLETTGFGFIWQQQFVDNETAFLNSFKRRLVDMYLQLWVSQVNLTSENRLFKHIKSNFVFESYLNINNRSLRTSLTKIRLSSHIFYIERGRWGPNNVDINDRKCTICNQVESEYHCLIECPKFNNERIGLLTDELKLNPCFQLFVKYFSSNDTKTQKNLALLCHKIQKEYKNSF